MRRDVRHSDQLVGNILYTLENDHKWWTGLVILVLRFANPNYYLHCKNSWKLIYHNRRYLRIITIISALLYLIAGQEGGIICC